jgi:hypothetical protein
MAITPSAIGGGPTGLVAPPPNKLVGAGPQIVGGARA